MLSLHSDAKGKTKKTKEKKGQAVRKTKSNIFKWRENDG
jgi:hypothetical protein